MMPQERPKWLRPDGTDERLVNPIAYMVGDFHHYKENLLSPYRDKTEYIERTYPDFVQKLLLRDKQISDIDALNRTFSDHPITEDEKRLHKELYKSELEQVQAFVTSAYGSVEAFMEWWES